MSCSQISKQLNDSEIIKAATDDRVYRALELTNGMRVMLISDPHTDISSAAMDVYVGYMKSPKDIPGLAHFCEHMLFLGTKKYPGENEYLKFLNDHGGSSNANTTNEHTNFFFDVGSDHLLGALDRFAQFFLEPLFTASATEREINAVNSENNKNNLDDNFRLDQLEKSLAKEGHDYNMFGPGNKFSIETRPKQHGYDVRDELLKFHSDHYSSNIMGMAILGKESLDELAEIVVPLFSKVENKNLPLCEWSEHPFGPEQLQTVCYVKPVKDICHLIVSWPLPDLHQYYKTNPGHYLSHLIGHKGRGSLLSELKARGWVNTLFGKKQKGARGFMFFVVKLDLTQQGFEHVDNIITLIYQYLNMLKREGVQEWFFQECSDLAAIQFRFKDKENPRSFTSFLAGQLHDYPLHEVLSAPYLQTEYKPELITRILDKLTAENMRYSIVSKHFETVTNNKEEWYGTEYKLEQVPKEKIKAWDNCGTHERLTLPDKNEFIPTNFDIVHREPKQGPAPVVIKDTGMTRLWFRQDDKFLRPKTLVSFELTSPIAHKDSLHAAMNVLFATLFNDAMDEYTYAAKITNLEYNLSYSMFSLNLTIRGFSHKLDVLLKKVVEKMVTFTVDEKRFAILKNNMVKNLRNVITGEPSEQAAYFMDVIVSEMHRTYEEQLDCLDELTPERLTAFIPEMLSKLFIEGLIYGNVTKKQALEMIETVENILKTKAGTKEILPCQKWKPRELQLPDGCYFLYRKVNSIHKNSSIGIYYQCGQQTTATNLLLNLFVQLIRKKFIKTLRTEEQLGYDVKCEVHRQSGSLGLQIIIQSDRSPEYVESRVEAFLHSIDEWLKSKSGEKFHETILGNVTSMTTQFSEYMNEIESKEYNFDRDNDQVSFLKTGTVEDLYKFYKEYICFDAPKRRKLSVHILSTVPKPTGDGDTPDASCPDNQTLPCPVDIPEPIVIKDVMAFKSEMAP